MMLAAALCAAWTGHGRADDAFKLAQISGEAMALAAMCTSVRVDTRALSVLTVKMGIEEPDIPWRDVRYFHRTTMEAWRGRNADDACAAADLLYGPKGSMAAGILVSGE
ncbi:MAG: hypothetical protein E5X86_26615 [Mesorhizobium sp.]|nr:MAG: hypothetical protein E5X86_26615 [Mesorhizobium sp.]